ncbi:hypothetical protein RhiJN_19757 [Ceratobasidium sp. AG-Ba]|nr:hypothetical protein RhiJN_04927 [Ceratobasidium sp. AG-Ba]QRV91739.1 hypothetical protein RhiJN_19757 [Ceratobasidium sp. AG-Ba]
MISPSNSSAFSAGSSEFQTSSSNTSNAPADPSPVTLSNTSAHSTTTSCARGCISSTSATHLATTGTPVTSTLGTPTLSTIPSPGPSTTSAYPDPTPDAPSITATEKASATETSTPVSTFLSTTVLDLASTSTISDSPIPIVTAAPDQPLDSDADPDDPDHILICLRVRFVKCAFTQFVIAKTTALPVGEPFLMPLPAPTSLEPPVVESASFLKLATTTAPSSARAGPNIKVSNDGLSMSTNMGEVSEPTKSGSGIVMIPTATTFTDSLGVSVATSVVNGVVVPTFSTVVGNKGLALSTITYSVTAITAAPIPPTTPPPDTLFTLTSWTTYMSANGSTVPAIAGQVGVLTTVSETYILEPSTTIPLDYFTSVVLRSTRTSLPSGPPSGSANTSSTSQASTVAATVVGSLVGITLLGVFLWVVCIKYRRRKRRAPDYAGCLSPTRGLKMADESRLCQESTLDLDGELQPRSSLVEPWVEDRQRSLPSRKIEREMEERGGRLVVPGRSARSARLLSLDPEDPEVEAELNNIRASLRAEAGLGSVSYADCFKQARTRS